MLPAIVGHRGARGEAPENTLPSFERAVIAGVSEIELDVRLSRDDELFVLDFLRQHKVLLVHGRAFNWPEPDHFRIVFLPHKDQLTAAIGKLAQFLPGYSQ